MRRKRLLHWFWILLLVIMHNIAAWAQQPPFIPPKDQVSYILYDLQQQKVLDGLNIDQPLQVASLVKIVTLTMAIKQLGADYRFKTQLTTNGYLEDGILRGNLILQGGFDPFLSSDDLANLLSTLNIKDVSGNFYYQSRQPIIESINPQQPVAASYNPAVDSLGIDFNRVWLQPNKPQFLQPDGQYGESPELFVITDHRQIPTPWVRVAWRNSGYHFHKFDPSKTLHRVPTIAESWDLPRSDEKLLQWLPIKQPAYHTAMILQTLAAHQGLILPEPQLIPASQEPSTSDANIIATHESISLAEIAPRILRYSNNIAVETIGFFLMSQSSNLVKSGCFEPGCIPGFVTHWLTQTYPQHNWQQAHIAQFSGLGHDNRLTTKQLVEFLDSLWQEPNVFSILQDGFITPPFLQPSYLSTHIQAKTGTLIGVSAIAGYLFLPNRNPLAFVIVLNNPEMTADLVNQTATRSPFSTPAQREWQQQTRQFQYKLLEFWAETLLLKYN